MYLIAIHCRYFYDDRNRAIIMMSSRKIPKQPMESRMLPTPPGAAFSSPGGTRSALPISSDTASRDTASHGKRRGAKSETGLALSSAGWLRLPSRLWEHFLAPPPGAYFGRLLVILQSVCDKTIWDLSDSHSLHASSWNLSVAQGVWPAYQVLTQRHPEVAPRPAGGRGQRPGGGRDLCHSAPDGAGEMFLAPVEQRRATDSRNSVHLLVLSPLLFS